MTDAATMKQAADTLRKAEDLRQQGRPEDAGSILKNMLRQFLPDADPTSRRTWARLWYELGLCRLATRQLNKAGKSFEHALEASPGATEADLRLVELRIDSDAALKNDMTPLYLSYVEKGADAHIRRGALRRLQQILRIKLTERPAVVVWRMEHLERLRQLEPTLNFPKLYLGRGYYLHDNFREAVAQLETMSGRAGQSHNVLNMLARSHEKLGHLEEAWRLYDLSLKTTPGQAGVHFRLGRLDLKLAEL